MRQQSQQTYRTQLVRTEEGLLALEESWKTLLDNIPNAPIFLTWEWMTTWWRHFGQDRELWVLAAWNDGDTLVGLAPWMIEHQKLGPLYIRRLRFIGSGLVCSDHLDVLARPDDKQAMCSAFVAYLECHQQEWDVLDLESLAQNSTLQNALAQADGRYWEGEPILCPYISLPSNWETYYATLGKKLRRNLQYSRNRLEREHPARVIFRQVTEANNLPVAMTSLITLNQNRLRGQGMSSPFDNRSFAGFHREMAALALERGWLRLYELEVDGQVIASAYRFYYGGVFYAYQTGFDPAWAKYSPGTLLISHAIQQAIAEGAIEFDWLRGTEEYKSSWKTGARANEHLFVSHGGRGHISLGAAAMAVAARSVGRTILPKTLSDWIRQFLSKS